MCKRMNAFIVLSILLLMLNQTSAIGTDKPLYYVDSINDYRLVELNPSADTAKIVIDSPCREHFFLTSDSIIYQDAKIDRYDRSDPFAVSISAKKTFKAPLGDIGSAKALSLPSNAFLYYADDDYVYYARENDSWRGLYQYNIATKKSSKLLSAKITVMEVKVKGNKIYYTVEYGDTGFYCYDLGAGKTEKLSDKILRLVTTDEKGNDIYQECEVKVIDNANEFTRTPKYLDAFYYFSKGFLVRLELPTLYSSEHIPIDVLTRHQNNLYFLSIKSTETKEVLLHCYDLETKDNTIVGIFPVKEGKYIYIDSSFIGKKEDNIYFNLYYGPMYENDGNYEHGLLMGGTFALNLTSNYNKLIIPVY